MQPTETTINSPISTDQAGPADGRQVYSIGDGRLVIDGLEIDDRKTVEVIERQPDAEAAVRSAIQIGARAIEIADGSLDAKTVEERFDSMTDDLRKQVSALSEDVAKTAEEAGEAFSKVAEGLLDEDEGSLVASLSTFKESFLEEVGDLFDEDSKSSVVSKFEAAVEAVQEAHRKTVDEALAAQKKIVENLIDPHDENGPVGRLNKAMTKQIDEVAEAVRVMHRELSAEKLADAAAQEVIDNSSHKGVAFESTLQAAVEPLIEPLGDAIEDKSQETGLLGRKKGDFIVDLNTEHTLGAEVRYVIEAKDSPLTTPKAKDEIETGMENRGAAIGLLVFAKQEYSPSKLSFKAYGNYAFVVYDRDASDDSALKLALMWARWMTLRELDGTSDELDLRRVAELIAKGTAAVKSLSQIRASHTKARNEVEKALSQAGGHVDSLEEQLTGVFTELEAEISRAEQEAE